MTEYAAVSTTSSTVSSAGIRRAIAVDAKPMRERSSNTSTRPSSWSRTVAVPEDGWAMAEAICRRLVFPAPFGPRTTQRSSPSTVHSTWSRMVVPFRTKDTPDRERTWLMRTSLPARAARPARSWGAPGRPRGGRCPVDQRRIDA
ncbi:hypothetical protein BC477_13530 [Clavibacter michiganensis subsp. michiganensis]|uniref:Uncharacterized protein n=1 Tax=Clavibacter michiganensis subsp. michiganensis TaxID=33013 RepID=A0A251XI23_CLAMM|nr:hypothetical protein BC477_13530 [Clavibacter michiganensis subsp. michiganensis]OUE02818.1 hypothetical protein CMMCAS07_12435 [Clavibacter michiganensis subsp. michiganensis]